MIRTDCQKPVQGNIILYTISQDSPDINQDVSEYEAKTDKTGGATNDSPWTGKVLP